MKHHYSFIFSHFIIFSLFVYFLVHTILHTSYSYSRTHICNLWKNAGIFNMVNYSCLFLTATISAFSSCLSIFVFKWIVICFFMYLFKSRLNYCSSYFWFSSLFLLIGIKFSVCTSWFKCQLKAKSWCFRSVIVKTSISSLEFSGQSSVRKKIS